MKKTIYFLLLANLFLLASCQTEEYEVITDQDQSSMSLDSEVYDLVFRTSMYDGSADDEIDGSPCFSIEFPYTVIVDGEEITISSEAERNAFLAGLAPGALPQDIELDFPVNIQNAGHQIVTVVNIQQFRGLQQGCRNSLGRNGAPINCARFSFPLRLTSYNRASQQSGSAVLNSQQELFQYLENISSSIVVSFEYPLEMVLGNRNITIPNQNRLRALLRDCED